MGADALARTPVRSQQTLSRVAILAALLLLAIYTAFAAIRLQHSESAAPNGEGLAARATTLAERLDAEADVLKAALSAGDAVARRAPDAPLDAAEAALRAAGPRATGAAVVLG
ncbi:MAG TPA: ATPase, partial [Caulobacteraceae bacterium]|nr:ATPase [Caulobacteraceae bacterium]